MTMNRGLYVPINTTGNVGTTELEARLALSALFEHNAAGIPRSGLLIPAGSSQTIAVTGAANMSYNLAAVNPVINTAANDGVYSFTATGTTNVVTTAAPATNSRIDLIWVKQNDKSKGDADNLAVLGVTQGVSATSPVAPALPARAMEVARATILSTTTATNTATITQTFTYAALKGTPIRVRNTTDRATITTPAISQQVARLDLEANGSLVEVWNGTAWVPPSVSNRYAEFTGPAIDSNPGSGTNWGLMVADGAKTFNNNFCTPKTTGNFGLSISISGVYAIHALWLPSSDPGSVVAAIYQNGSSPVASFSRSSTYGNWETTVGHPGLYLAAGEYVDFTTANSSGSIFGSRVYISKLS